MMRAFAAIAVALFHFTNGSYQEGPLIKSESLREFFTYGAQGVELFYLISGFVITFALVKKGYLIKDFFKFVSKRVIRIIPPYFFTIFAIVGVSLFLARFIWYSPYAFPYAQIMVNMSFTADLFPNIDWINPIFKTLKVEFQWYFLLGLVVPFISKRNTIFIAFTLAILSATYFTLHIDSALISSPYFLLGVTCYFIFDRGFNLFHGISIALIFSLLLWKYQWEDIIVAALGIQLILFVPEKFKFANLTGKISYSYYLIHGLIGGQFLYFTSDSEFAYNYPWLMILFALILSWFGAYLMYNFIERPSLKISKKIKYSENAKSD